MSDEISPLLNAIEAQEQACNRNGDLADERVKALNEYLGKPYGNEVEGRSQVVSRDVADTIEWIKPSLMRIFASGDEIVSFDPKGEEDVEGAQQETDFANYILTQKNNWFRTSYVWFTDALMQKNAYVKTWWEDKTDVTQESYDGLSSDQMAILAQDPEVEIVEQEESPDPFLPGMMVYKVKVKRTSEYGCVKYREIPPERTLVSQWAQSVDLEDVDFFEHFEWQTLSEMREAGLEIPEDLGDESTSGFADEEEDARNLYGEPFSEEDSSTHKASRRYKVREVWIRHDDDEDGIAELRHVIVVGKHILLNEDAEFIPAAAITPKMMPHRHVGRSIHDEIADLQLIKTTLLRGTLDNQYLSNHGRTAIDEKRVNLDDMLTSRPGGVVRTEGPPSNSILPFVHPNMMKDGISAIEYIDQIKQNRTGVTAYVTSVDENALNKTAAGTNMLQNAAMAKIELIARVFAETGVKRLMWLIHALSLLNSRKPEVIRLRNKWVTVDPRQWKKRSDMTVSVGLGTGNRDQQLVHLGSILAIQERVLPLGLVSLQNFHHALTKYTQAAGFKDHESFWTAPPENAQLPPPPNPAEQEMVKQRAETERTVFKEKAETERTQMELQVEMAKIASAERTTEFQANENRAVKGAELEYDAKKTDVTLQHQQKEQQHAAHDENMNAFIQAAQKVVESQKTLEGSSSQQMLQAITQALQQLLQSQGELAKLVSAKRVLERDPKTGKAVSSRLEQ